MALILHLIADCPTEQAAAELLQAFLTSLAAWGPKPQEQPQRYWKMHECFEFWLTFHPPTLQAHGAIRGLASGAWHDLDVDPERSGVWNRGAAGPFLSEQVVWAELLFHP
ncbi:MAG: hypothetical protein ACKO0M_08975 [Cyanobium sp.]